MKPSQVSFVSLAYFALLVASAGLSWAMAGGPDLAGLFLWMLTLPWNWLLGSILELAIPDIFDHSLVPGLIMALFSGLINTAILWWLEKKLQKRRPKA